ncbi:hypothetical protein C1I59_23450 [Paenibacillus polymyxa]|nr:ABC transporter permease subunit [Paenibacillus polymyxa]TKH33564.1 hypothetical protein C1I59_23450 [Paenibacillus polymyxa]
MGLALYFATILSFQTWFKNFFKGILFFPSLMNGVAIGFIFLFFFKPDGTLDTLLQAVGLGSYVKLWLGNPEIINISLAGTSIWRYMGFNFIVFLGAISSISSDLYEAADIDGANRWHQFRSIILPTIKRILQLNLILAISGAFIALLPIVVILFASLKTKAEYAASSPLTPPVNWLNWGNYAKAFVDGNMLTGFLNTAFILLISIIGATLTGSMIAYILNRFKFKGKSLMLGAFLLATLIPGVTTQVSTFQIINKLELFNTPWAAILLYLGTDIIAVYIFLQFLDSIAVALDESAMLDGASYLTIYWRIILPLLKPAIVTVIIIKGVNIYNDFYTPFLYMPKTSLQVISTALFKFKGPYGSQWEVISAGIIIAIIPTLVAFLSLQKYIYNGFAQGSVK